jgi:prepilin-type N-terminal cleavage/methylation domain-containing protein
MTTTQTNEKGFTLVELAIVLVIVGLLIAGILKGQELIANSQVASTVSQMNGIQAAKDTFRDKYRGFPGDMLNAQVRIPNCTAANTCNNGTGNGQIGVVPGGAPAGESIQFFVHLLRDGLLSGYTGDTANLQFGEALPSANVGGGFTVGYGGTPTASVAGRQGHWIAVAGVSNGAVTATNGLLAPAQAFNIDSKLDDGIPDTGSILATTGACVAGGQYASALDQGVCTIYYRIGN